MPGGEARKGIDPTRPRIGATVSEGVGHRGRAREEGSFRGRVEIDKSGDSAHRGLTSLPSILLPAHGISSLDRFSDVERDPINDVIFHVSGKKILMQQ